MRFVSLFAHGFLALLACSACSACSASKEEQSTNLVTKDGGGGIEIDGATDEDGGFLVDAPATEATSSSDCAEENKQIYVVTSSNQLHRFAPATLAFTKVGDLKCPAGSATPFSMAVDRSGMAWVLFDDGKIFKVSTKDASCTATTYQANQESFGKFGMAFVSDVAGAPAETLYVADYYSKGLAKIDVGTLKLSFLGDFGGFSGAGELTGRGDRIFAFFNTPPTAPTLPPRVAELEKTGKIITTKNLAGTTIGSGWAFAHWGGTFWLFTAPMGSSQVTEYDFEMSSSNVVTKSLGFVIVGAGVSTCAPTERPK